MATFVTRVELHSATESDYVRLHREMEGRGFTRLIYGNDAKRYHLPTAEYWYEGNATRDGVFELADTAAGETGCSSWILVTESKGCTFRLAQG